MADRIEYGPTDVGDPQCLESEFLQLRCGLGGLGGVAVAQLRTPHADAYTDLALTPVSDEETDTLELFTQNDAARTEVARTRKIAELTHGVPAPVEALRT